MTVARHQISGEVFTAFARYGGDPAAVRLVADARLSKTKLLVQHVLRAAARTGHRDARRAMAAYDLLAEVQRHDPEAVESVLRYPLVGAWALRCALRMRDGDADADLVFLSRVAATAAINAGLPVTIDLGHVADRLYLPALGTATGTGAGAATVTVHQDGAEIVGGGRTTMIPRDRHQSATGWRPLRWVTGESGTRRFDVVLDSEMPRSLPVSLATENALSDEDAVAWAGRLLGGWRLLVAEQPAVADDVSAVLRVVAPMRDRPLRAASATLGDTFGCVVMSLPLDDVHAAVTLTHEVQHAKLTGLTDLTTLVDDASSARFYAPWREDPRPALGLVHGLYAHMAVAGFWRTHRDRCAQADRVDAGVEYVRWSSACREVAETLLASDVLTSVGRGLVEVIACQLAEWATEPVDRDVTETAFRQAAEHRIRWAAG